MIITGMSCYHHHLIHVAALSERSQVIKIPTPSLQMTQAGVCNIDTSHWHSGKLIYSANDHNWNERSEERRKRKYSTQRTESGNQNTHPKLANDPSGSL